MEYAYANDHLNDYNVDFCSEKNKQTWSSLGAFDNSEFILRQRSH